MATFSVFSRIRADDPAAEDRMMFVRDAFSWLALAFAPLVLFAYRLWLALAAYAAAVVMLGVLSVLDAAPTASLQVALLGLHLLVGFELPALRARKLLRCGYVEEGVVIASTRDLAERRFFDAWTPRRPAPSGAPRPASAAGGASRPPAAVIGVFPGN